MWSTKAYRRRQPIVQQADYLPYGEKCINSTLISGENDYLYGGKEFQAPVFNIPWYDSQARFQTTDGMFVSLDPLCEKYYSLSPYAYCAGNPVNLVDPEGESTYVVEEGIDRYSVVDGGDPDDGDDNIYVVTIDSEGNIQRGRSIGRSATPYSFYDSSESGWKAIHAYIDLTDESAFRFTDYFVDNDISLFDYIRKARNYGLFDFKETNFDENEVGIHHEEPHKYRGMPISRGKKPIIASARDVGNIVAGYMSADNHLRKDWDGKSVGIKKGNSYEGTKNVLGCLVGRYYHIDDQRIKYTKNYEKPA